MQSWRHTVAVEGQHRRDHPVKVPSVGVAGLELDPSLRYPMLIPDITEKIKPEGAMFIHQRYCTRPASAVSTKMNLLRKMTRPEIDHQRRIVHPCRVFMTGALAVASRN